MLQLGWELVNSSNLLIYVSAFVLQIQYAASADSVNDEEPNELEKYEDWCIRKSSFTNNIARVTFG